MPRLPDQARPGPGRPGVLACVLALVVLAAAPATASAQVVATSEYLGLMDTDGDGRVSLEEYLAWMTYAFERMDVNGDGVLGADELPGGKGSPVTLAGHRARLTDRFNRQDANTDGFLD